MANAPFTAEQLEFLRKNFAPIPHDHSWDQVKDVDGETLTERVIMIDNVLDTLEDEVFAEDPSGDDPSEG